MIIFYLIGQLVGAAVGALLGAVILRLATRMIAGFKPPYWDAYRATYAGFAVSLIIGFFLGFLIGSAGQKIDASAIILTSVVGFFAQAAVYTAMLKGPDNVPLEFGRACLISIVQLLIVVVGVLTIVAIVTVLGSLAEQTNNSTMSPLSTPKAAEKRPVDLRYAEPPEPTPARTPAPTPSVDSVNEAKDMAMRTYPALRIAGSAMNSAFVARYKWYQSNDPSYFEDSSWPTRLAEEVAISLKAK